jgi:hypothetical protein
VVVLALSDSEYQAAACALFYRKRRKLALKEKRMSVTSRLSKRDRQLADWFRRQGFLRPYLTVAALRKADIKPQTAAALLNKETGNGKNIFGCDHGAGRGFCHQNVTEARVRQLRASGLANGIGPTQLTWPGYVDRANRAGGVWKPFVNMVVGFSIFGELFVDEGRSIWGAAKRYNGADAYATDFVRRRQGYELKLRSAGFAV